MGQSLVRQASKAVSCRQHETAHVALLQHRFAVTPKAPGLDRHGRTGLSLSAMRRKAESRAPARIKRRRMTPSRLPFTTRNGTKTPQSREKGHGGRSVVLKYTGMHSVDPTGRLSARASRRSLEGPGKAGFEGRRTHGSKQAGIQQTPVRRAARRFGRQLRPRQHGRLRRRWRREAGRGPGRRRRVQRNVRHHHVQPHGRPACSRPGVLRRRRIGRGVLQHPRRPVPVRQDGRQGVPLPGHRPARNLGRRPHVHHQAARRRQVPRRHRVQRRRREGVHRAPAGAQPQLRHAVRVLRVRRRGHQQRREERGSRSIPPL